MGVLVVEVDGVEDMANAVSCNRWSRDDMRGLLDVLEHWKVMERLFIFTRAGDEVVLQ